MGCRTRVVSDLYGEAGAMGRGNITNISINLPRLALEIDKNHKELDKEAKFDLLQAKWDEVAKVVKDILLDRYHKVCKEQLMIFLQIVVITYGVKTSKMI